MDKQKIRNILDENSIDGVENTWVFYKEGIEAAVNEIAELEANPLDALVSLPELLPCPFCGGRASRGMFNIWCDKCGAKTEKNVDATDRQVIERWNERAT